MPFRRASQKRRERASLRQGLRATLALFCLVPIARVEAADPLVLQLRWRPGAESAGYYAALDKGYYRREGLAVVIRPGGPQIDPAKVLASGAADIAVDWLASALAARARGGDLVNIAQVFDGSGAALVCRRSRDISRLADLKGKSLEVAPSEKYALLAFLAKLGLLVRGAHRQVRLLRERGGEGVPKSGKADCVATASYDEGGPLADGAFSLQRFVVFRYADEGAATLEDGLYALEQRLEDSLMRQHLARFLRASFEGWRFALAHPLEAARMMPVTEGSLTGREEGRMLGEISDLIGGSGPSLGYLDPALYERNVAFLLALSSHPIIAKTPVAAWTHQIWTTAVQSAPNRAGRR